MKAKLIVIYQVQDGYVSGRRPQEVHIDYEEIRQCSSVEEAMKLVNDSCQDHFEQHISFGLDDSDDVEEQVKDILAGNS